MSRFRTSIGLLMTFVAVVGVNIGALRALAIANLEAAVATVLILLSLQLGLWFGLRGPVRYRAVLARIRCLRSGGAVDHSLAHGRSEPRGFRLLDRSLSRGFDQPSNELATPVPAPPPEQHSHHGVFVRGDCLPTTMAHGPGRGPPGSLDSQTHVAASPKAPRVRNHHSTSALADSTLRNDFRSFNAPSGRAGLLPARAGASDLGQDQVSLHPKTRQLAEHGGNRD